jgi:uracil permease
MKKNIKQNIKDWILSVQHLFAMFGACVLVPLLVGINPSIAIMTAGIGTLIFHLCTKGKVPVFLGSSFAFITPIITINSMYNDYAYVQGGIIVVGLIYMLMSFIVYKIGVDKINKILPPHIVGAMIIVIGLSLVPSAITNIQTNTLVACVTLAISVLISIFGRGFLKQLGILIGVICGYLLSLSLGIVDTSIIQNANLVFIPTLTLPKFSLEAIIVIAPLSLCTLCEHIGDVTTNGTVVGKDFIKNPGLHRTMLGDGLATLVAGLLGSVPNTTYGENTSLLAITKNYNPKLLRRTAVIAIVLSFIGVFGATLQSVPSSVIGGISLQLYCMIAYIGFKNIKDNKSYKSIKNLIVIAIILIVGLGGFTITIGGIAISGLTLSIIIGVILNIILNHKELK